MANLAPDDYSLDRMATYAAHFTDVNGNFSTSGSFIGNVSEESRLARQTKAAKVADDYYSLVSPLYEQGWGQRFHFAPLTPGLNIGDSMTAYEREFARMAGLKKGMRVLDMGCGVGGPARTLARSIGCEIVGVANNAWLVERGEALTKEQGLDGLMSFVNSDFMNLPFEDATFDAVYAFEALCHAPDLNVVYKEAYRVLKPGGLFAFSDWAMTDNAPGPWYYGPAGDFWHAVDWKEFWQIFQMSPFFLFFANSVYRIMVLFGVLPREVLQLMDTMWFCCRSVAYGGKLDIFTPMYMLASRKPGCK
ncbi:S-adenosyl-L-methionine-dependent methyltransferase [Bombardia bombarda]|uniref:Sterol 24-C-methyltransferase n=1 Tax=Bombardia bombarda TaxID=252184 RepID=A0AA39WLY5_9PEZI|nr:S-adenosyl-L-methionine-dependent methyltransferase [Bombardia bombarda]